MTHWLPGLGLVAAAVIFGSTFVLVKEAVQDVPPFEFIAIRFAIGAALLWLVWRPRLTRAALRGGAVCGAALAAGYGLQTSGLVHTGATNAGFITGLFVVFTPVLAALVFRRAPRPVVIAAVVLAGIGLALLSLELVNGRPSFSGGDLLVLGCAVAFAGHIVALGRYAPGGDHRALAFVQVALTALVFGALMPLEDLAPPVGRTFWTAIAVTSIGSTAFGFAVQTWAQSRLSPTRTAVILTTEPVFAGVFGFLWLDERLTPRNWAGAGLILTAMLLAEVRPARPEQEA